MMSDVLRNKLIKIKLIEMNPYIRRASKHQIQGGYSTGIRINPHYQLHYVCKGKGLFIIDGKSYPANKGNLLFWKPSEEHIFESDIDNPMRVIGVQFDFTQNISHKDYPLIPYNREEFHEDLVNEIIEFKDCIPFPTYIQLSQLHQGEYYLNEIVKGFQNKSLFYKEMISALLKAFLLMALHDYQMSNNKKTSNTENVNDIISYLHNHYNSRLTNKQLGEIFGFHPNYINRLVVKYTNMSIQQYLINIRMNKAIDLLQNSNKSISEIAEIVGYNSIHYFSRTFKNKIGMAPSNFR